MRAVAAAATFGMTSTVACAVYGLPATEEEEVEEHCDTRGSTCADCLECATPTKEGRGDSDDALQCKEAYELCYGNDRTCSPDESNCCKFDACRASCDEQHGPNTPAAWQCICGSNSRQECDLGAAPTGTCATMHSLGAILTLGPDGWMTCVHDACDASCAE